MAEMTKHANATPSVYARGDVFLGDGFVPAAEATVSVFDHSFLYGDGVFETLVVRNGRSFELDAHLTRLFDSCAVLRLDVPLGRDRLVEIVAEIIERNAITSGLVRVVVSRGDGYPNSDPRQTVGSKVVVLTQEATPYTDTDLAGISLTVASTRRVPPVSIDPRVKSNNYLNHIMAKLEAIAADADDALMLDIEGGVAELPGRNVFAVRGDELITPPPTYILAGITRGAVLSLCRAGEVPQVRTTTERPMTLYDLYTADEVFVTSTGTGVAWVSSVDGRRVGSGTAGPVATALAALYDELLERQPAPQVAA